MDKLMRPTDDGRLFEEHESKMKRAIAQSFLGTPDELRRAEQADESSRLGKETV